MSRAALLIQTICTFASDFSAFISLTTSSASAASDFSAAIVRSPPSRAVSIAIILPTPPQPMSSTLEFREAPSAAMDFVNPMTSVL